MNDKSGVMKKNRFEDLEIWQDARILAKEMYLLTRPEPFIKIAKGSFGETHSQIYRAFDYDYISKEAQDNLLDQAILLSKKIFGIISYLNKAHIQIQRLITLNVEFSTLNPSP